MNGKKIGLRGRGWIFVPASAVLALASALTPAHATHLGDGLNADQSFVSASDQLLAAVSSWERLPESARASRIAALAQLAQHRQEHLLLLLQKNPQVALARMMPRSLRERLPAAAAAYVEQEVALQGTVLAQIADDLAKGVSHTTWKLVPAGGGKALEMHLADPTASERDLMSWANRKVDLTALRIGDHLVLGDKKRVQLLAAGSTTMTTTGTTTATSNPIVQGNQNTLVVLANFSDTPLTCTAADLQNRLFATGGATMNQGYIESSGGLVTFSGKVIGPFNISYTSTGSCDTNGWSMALDSAARAAGFDPSTYTRVSYVTPKNATCGWSGLGSLGGTPPTHTWIQSCGSTGVFSHELGHNLLFNHASTATSEYGDYSDPMGATMLVQSNAANRVMAGWIGSGQILDVSVGGSYAVSAVESATATSPRALRLPKPDTGETYYVSMRQPTGIDANLLSGYQNVLSIHHSSGVMPTKTVFDAAVAPGQSWTDTVNGIQFVNQGVSGSIATVGLSFGASSCVRSSPAVNITPASQTAGAGSTLGYTVSVTNRNTAACASSTFNLAQTLPAGFSGAFASPSLAIAPGATASSNWTVASVATVADATYTLTASATDAVGGASSSVHASDIVYTAPSCTRSAPLVSVSPASQTGAPGATLPYTVTVTNRNSSACGTSTFNLGQVLPGAFSGAYGSTSLAIAAGASSSSTWSVATSAGTVAGTYTLTASAADSVAGNTASGQASEVIVAADSTAPTLAITSPAAGATLSGRNVAITATASDASGIKSVAFYIDGNSLATLTAAPYAANWNLRKAASGTHQIQVRATDGAGNVAQQSINVSVK